jgi:hypothetical protein
LFALGPVLLDSQKSELFFQEPILDLDARLLRVQALPLPLNRCS